MTRNLLLMFGLIIAHAFQLSANTSTATIKVEKTNALEQNFEAWPAEGWNTYILDQGKGWENKSGDAYEGTGYMERKKEYKECNDWMVSPSFTVPAHGMLEFYEKNYRVTHSKFKEHGIYISEGSADPADGDFVLLKNCNVPQDEWGMNSVYLEAYAGKDVHIAFRYFTGKGASNWYVDAIRVYDVPANGIAISEVNIPRFIKSAQNIAPQLTVENTGHSIAENVSVSITSEAYTHTQNITIDPLSTKEVTFEEIAIDELSVFNINVTLTVGDDTYTAEATAKSEALVPARAFAYNVYANEGTIERGPVNFLTTDHEDITATPNANSDILTAYAGTMINNLWFTNITLHYEKGNRSNERADSKGELPINYVLINPENGDFYNICPTENVFAEMSYNPADNKVYALKTSSSTQSLYSIDYVNGETNLVAEAPSGQSILRAFAIDQEGNAYGVGEDKNFYSVNLTDLSTTLIGKTGAPTIKYTQSMAFDHANNTLYWNHANSSDGKLFVIDVETGMATFLGDHVGNAEICAMGFISGEEKNYAAIKTTNPAGDLLNKLEINMNGNELVTDESGIATFINLEKDTPYHYTIGFRDDIFKEEDLTITESGVIEIEVDGIEVYDANITTVEAPEFGFIGSPTEIIVKVCNDGLTLIENATLRLTVGAKEYTYDMPVGFGIMYNVQFDVDITEDANITASIEVEGDLTPDNNTFTTQIKALADNKAYAYRIYSDDSSEENGPVTFNVSTPGTITSLEHAQKDNVEPRGGVLINNYWFVNNVVATDDGQTPLNFSLIHKENGEQLAIVDCDMIFNTMSYDYSTETLYGIALAETGFTQLYTINYLTGEYTMVAETADLLGHVVGFAINAEGVAYILVTDDVLYTIDLSTFALTEVGDVGVDVDSYPQSMAFDYSSNTLFWNYCGTIDGIEYVINPATAKASKIGSLQENAEIVAMGFPYGDEKYYAAIRTVNNEGENLSEVTVQMNGESKETDAAGIALFMNLNADQEYAFVATKDDKAVASTLIADECKIVEVNMDDYVGIEEYALTGINIYPNPSNGIVNISGMENILSAKVIDINGRVITTIEHITPTSSVNLKDQAKGVYQLILQSEKGISKKTIILQ